jgi:SM-20-related protein
MKATRWPGCFFWLPPAVSGIHKLFQPTYMHIPPGTSLDDKRLERLADQLAQDGYGLIDHFLSDEEIDLFIERFRDLDEEGSFKKAGIGKMEQFTVDRSIRGDYIRWIDPQDMTAVTAAYVSRVRQMMAFLNRSLFLGIKDFEAHFAMYPEGTFYKRHADRFYKNPHRVISMVCYMNKGWQAADGGQLRMFLDKREVDIAPLPGRLACFRSEIEHEVLLTHKPRYSITGWMLDQIGELTFL